jgi:hypothetical protein
VIDEEFNIGYRECDIYTYRKRGRERGGGRERERGMMMMEREMMEREMMERGIEKKRERGREREREREFTQYTRTHTHTNTHSCTHTCTHTHCAARTKCSLSSCFFSGSGHVPGASLMQKLLYQNSFPVCVGDRER